MEAKGLFNEWTGFRDREKIKYNIPGRETVQTKDCRKCSVCVCVCVCVKCNLKKIWDSRVRALASRSGKEGG